jgi:hypothetical protein
MSAIIPCSPYDFRHTLMAEWAALNWFPESSLKIRFIRASRRRILTVMTKLLEQALLVARELPPETQDDIARIILQLARADDAPPIVLSSDERAAVAASKEAASRGEFATDEQVRAVWAKHGL